MKEQVLFSDLGVIEYGAAWDMQEKMLKEKVQRKSALITAEGESESDEGDFIHHHLLFCEHPPVYTLGKSGKASHILINDKEREERGIAFYNTNRGGDITFHGPGQIVGYPILDLERFFTDIGKYLRGLEEMVILTLAEYGLKGERSAGETGVWLDTNDPSKARKICAMGVRCSRWVTMHGFALNVNTDLNYFNYIIPCGIQDKKVASLDVELSYRVPLAEVSGKLRKNFEKVFDCEIVVR
ncbi:lipoyl(octanoyl) transferase LipB [Pollutibacter soli]|uniref:lipoyl(octanoyl) transferase LipB n=1 Tax=Pollutibacter soli TaxID=3034157 RepID=UPI00301375CE